MSGVSSVVMKRPSKLMSLIVAIFATCSLVAAAETAKANPSPSPSHETTAQVGDWTPPPPVFINIDFKGGTLGDSIAEISKIKDVSFNLITTKSEDLATPLPPFSLRNASLATVVSVVQQLLGSHEFDLNLISSERNTVVAVLKHRSAPVTHEPETPTLTESFQLGRMLGAQPIDDIVGAIRTAWELDPQHSADALRLKFHPATSILIVNGPPAAIEISRKIVSSLKLPEKPREQPSSK
jgi:hypothetical protein